MTVSKFCEKCGKMMWDVQPRKRVCDTCIKEAKKPDKKAALKPRIKSIEQCVREAAALGISYGQYVQRGLDKE